MNQIINAKHLQETSVLHDAFKNASPFKHVLIENLLTDSFWKTILAEFPKPPAAGEMKNEYGLPNRKHVVQHIRELGASFLVWDELLKSTEFIAWLEYVTGIKGLIFDPEYHGAGTHNCFDKQDMDVHIDFNYHKTTGFHRRLNLIVYISEEWKKEYGGYLTLHKDPWNPQKDKWESFPCFGNNAVIFETNEISWHGFDEIKLPEDKKHLSRKSLTVYYYSKERPQEEIGRLHSTVYVPKPMSGKIRPGVTLSDENYKDLVRSFARRNQFAQGFYERESQLLENIEHHRYLIQQYEEAFKIPILGYVKQVGKLTGILPTYVVNNVLAASMEAIKNIESVKLEGFVPPFVNEGQNVLEIWIDEKLVETVSVQERFEVTLPLVKEAGEKFRFAVSSEKSVSPKEMEINNDDTKFCFVFIALSFE